MNKQALHTTSEMGGNPTDLLIALGGATGSGKTALAIELAHTYPKLAVLSADSRQIYKRLDIGSAKVGVAGTDDHLTGQSEPVWIYEGIPQYLIDIAEPRLYRGNEDKSAEPILFNSNLPRHLEGPPQDQIHIAAPESNFTAADYQEEAYRLIRACWARDRVPILVGGSGLYISAVTQGFIFEGAGQQSIRNRYRDFSNDELIKLLHERGITPTQPEQGNRRRLIRSLERIELGVQAIGTKREPITKNVHTFILNRPWPELRGHASAMVKERLELGLVDETKQLIKDGIDKSWLKSMGLSYRLVIAMLDNEFPESELELRMVQAFRQLMRRQQTWFKRMEGASLNSREEIIAGINALFTIHQLSG